MNIMCFYSYITLSKIEINLLLEDGSYTDVRYKIKKFKIKYDKLNIENSTVREYDSKKLETMNVYIKTISELPKLIRYVKFLNDLEFSKNIVPQLIDKYPNSKIKTIKYINKENYLNKE